MKTPVVSAGFIGLKRPPLAYLVIRYNCNIAGRKLGSPFGLEVV